MSSAPAIADAGSAAARSAPVLLCEKVTAARRLEPVQVGLPFPMGRLRSDDALALLDGGRRALPSQWRPLAAWPDGSVRWALLDFLATVEAGEAPSLHLEVVRGGHPAAAGQGLSVTEHADRHEAAAGGVVFWISKRTLAITGAVLRAGEAPLRASWRLTTRGAAAEPVIRSIQVEARGPVRATLLARGAYPAVRGRGEIEIDARLSFFSGTGLVKCEVLLRNPRAARHAGGLWDLGDPRSACFEDFSLALELAGGKELEWTREPRDEPRRAASGLVSIFQASSGGEAWNGRNHADRNGRVPLEFRGFRVRGPGGVEDGLRSSPAISLTGEGLRAALAVERFWQEFPKSLEAGEGRMRLGLFPREHGAPFELQPGEQKAHVAWLCVEPVRPGSTASPLTWVHDPLRASASPSWHASSGAWGRLVPEADDPHVEYRALTDAAVEGESSFFAKREVIDEYGWRSFGDVYADHENAHYAGPKPVVSHYNNQYDLVHGLLVKFARGGDSRCFELARDLARHVIDIDVYHTHDDKAAYSGGLFWHTDHYADAHRSTHRTYSKDHPRALAKQPYGGGPSNEHDYATGLLFYHYLSGCPRAREAVLGLAQWVIDMDDGAKSPLAFLDRSPTGFASSTFSPDYHGPGRGAGNSICTLLDAFVLDEERRYLAKAEDLIRRCIHPEDDPASLGIGDPESRWSYLVFLQALGKHLDVKAERRDFDDAFAYSRASLAAYAAWMLEHETPYMQVLDRVEYPTETWPAHDLRKSIVFDFAAEYGPRGRSAEFRQAAERYFAEAIAGVASFETRACTRPLAVLLQNGTLRSAFRAGVRGPGDPPPFEERRFARRDPFVPQKERVKRLLGSPRGIVRLAMGLLSGCVRRRDP